MLIKNVKTQLEYNDLKTKKLVSNDTGNIILIALEKGATLASHVSSTDASILVLEGNITFEINGEIHEMEANDLYAFKKDEVHEIQAHDDSKVLLIK